MSTRIKDEARILDTSERELVEATHHPALQAASQSDLRDTLGRLRERRDRAQALASRARRNARRGGGFDHDNSGMRQKAGLLAEAVRRLNKELARRKAAERRAGLQDNAARALELKRAAGRPERPGAGSTRNRGMQPVESDKTRKIGSSMEAGRVSQFVRDAQAKRDARG